MDEELQPRDAKLVKSILQSMGVEHYEPRVVNQFLDFSYRYVVDVLEDAQVYSEHAGKSAIETDDLKLAIQARVNQSFSQPPPRETLMELAKLRNRYPLPRIIGGPGLALPPEADCLIAPNYQLAVPKRSFAEGPPEESDGRDGPFAAWRKPCTPPLEDREVHSTQQPTQLQRSDQDRKVSFAMCTKGLKP